MPTAVQPPGPKGLPPLVEAVRFFRRPTEVLTRIARQYGDIAHLRVGHRHVYVLSHPEYVKEMLVTNSAIFAKGPLMKGAQRVLGEGLLSSRGEKHVRQRRATAPAFHERRIQGYAATMVECASRAAALWRDGETRDVHEEMMRLTLSIVGRTLFSADFGNEPALGEALNTLIRMSALAVLPMMSVLERLPLAPMRRIRRALRQLNAVVYALIEEHRRAPQNDMVSLLLETYGEGVSNRELRDECVAMIFAGYETTSNLLAWTWYLLSQNPQAEAQLHRELDEALGGRLPTSSDLPRLRYTEMVLSESLRMYPPAWAIGRRAMQAARIGGYRIPKGSIVLTSQWVLNYDARFYPDPQRFDPERWLAEARGTRPAYAFFPFGAGPRQCIGEGFAWTEGVLLIATIAQQWRMRHDPGHRVEVQAVVTLRPRYGMRMVLEKRVPAVMRCEAVENSPQRTQRSQRT
jgi:cytochrome P450